MRSSTLFVSPNAVFRSRSLSPSWTSIPKRGRSDRLVKEFSAPLGELEDLRRIHNWQGREENRRVIWGVDFPGLKSI